LQVHRQPFFVRDDILTDTAKVVSTETADVITFVGDGEPTLNSDLGWLIKKSKVEFGLPVAVITNGSLLFQPDVQADLLAADIVIPTLDAGNPTIFKQINRPHRAIDFYKMVNGLLEFRRQFAGKFWLEVMLVQNVNDSDDQLSELRAVVSDIQPDRIFVMTPIRPPVEKWVKCPKPVRVKAAEQVLSNAIPLTERENGDFGVTEFSDASQAIMEISGRHPLRLEQAQAIAVRFGEPDVIEKLLESKKIRLSRYHAIDFVHPQIDWSVSGQKKSFTPDITIRQTQCCVYQVEVKWPDRERHLRVVLADGYYNRLSMGLVNQEQLLESCFTYFVDHDLLDQLDDRFHLKDIGQRYPEYENDIRALISRKRRERNGS